MQDGSILAGASPPGLVLSCLLLVGMLTILGSWLLLLANLGLLVVVICLLRLDLRRMMQRMSLLAPLALLFSLTVVLTTPGRELVAVSILGLRLGVTAAGVDKAAVVILKMFNSLLIMLLLLQVLGTRRFLQALRELRIPALFVRLADFILRYFTIIAAELARMRLARKARCFNFKQSILRGHAFRTLTQLLGVLFLRSYNRGERIYLAMLSRGYSGQLNWDLHGHATPPNFRIELAIGLYGLLLLSLDKGWLLW